MSSGPVVSSDREPRGCIALVDDGVPPHLRLTGAIDKGAVRAFRLRVPPAAWPARVDLTEVTSLDAAGVELLVHLARKQKRTGGELEVVEPPVRLRRLLEKSGLTRVSHWALSSAAAVTPKGPGAGSPAPA